MRIIAALALLYWVYKRNQQAPPPEPPPLPLPPPSEEPLLVDYEEL
ncbi:hypothetical protein [Phaeodactylibacter xiamenensis]|nr:hypothetical protein [Phaeodactylibacter xiamenensis]